MPWSVGGFIRNVNHPEIFLIQVGFVWNDGVVWFPTNPAILRGDTNRWHMN